MGQAWRSGLCHPALRLWCHSITKEMRCLVAHLASGLWRLLTHMAKAAMSNAVRPQHTQEGLWLAALAVNNTHTFISRLDWESGGITGLPSSLAGLGKRGRVRAPLHAPLDQCCVPHTCLYAVQIKTRGLGEALWAPCCRQCYGFGLLLWGTIGHIPCTWASTGGVAWCCSWCHLHFPAYFLAQQTCAGCGVCLCLCFCVSCFLVNPGILCGTSPQRCWH